jgi:hypothetical protein
MKRLRLAVWVVAFRFFVGAFPWVFGEAASRAYWAAFARRVGSP